MHRETLNSDLDLGWELLTVGQLVVRFPETAPILENRGIDYCCDGKRSLEEACLLKGLDAQQLRKDIADVLSDQSGNQERDWEQESLSALIDHIVTTHHVYIRTERTRITALAQKVAHVHGSRHPELMRLSESVEKLFPILEKHMDEEERTFFPLARQWETAGSDIAMASPLAFELERLEQDHHEVGRLLELIRKLSSGFSPPADGCNSYRSLYQGLEDLEADVHTHIHKENNILHARILAALGKNGKHMAAPYSCCGT